MSSKLRVAGAFGCVALFNPLMRVAASDGPIETDRPDFVESSSTVNPRHMQIETSGELASDTTIAYSTPSLLRIGLIRNLELRAETDGYITNQGENGFADLSLGLKLHNASGGPLDEEEDGPSSAWLLHVDIPSGDEAYSEPGLRPSLRYVIEYELPADWGLGVMPGIAWDNDSEEQRRVGGLLGVVVGKSIGDGARAFVELAFERIALTHNDENVASFDTGLAWRLGRDIQVDGAVRLGLTPETPDVAATIGLSMRW